MTHSYRAGERLLFESDDGQERRRVTLIEGESIALMERTSGPDTEVAYGVEAHAHKMLFKAQECAKALGVHVDEAIEELVSLFDERGEGLSFGDVMDLFDHNDAKYAYVAWTDGGDIALRRSE
jgi:hypothetical protein